MKGDFVYANGMNISQSRKLFRFYFGEFFLKAEKNEKELRFDVYLKSVAEGENGEKIHLEDYCDIEWFNEFWNEQSNARPSEGIFNLIILKEED